MSNLTYVNVLEEIRARIADKMGSGNPLEDIVTLYTDVPTDVYSADLLPIIVVYDSYFALDEKISSHIEKDNIGIRVELLCSRPTTGTYDYSNQTGPLVLLEELLNAIETNTSDDVDLKLSPYTWGLNSRRVSKEYKDNLIIYVIDLEYQLRNYSVGGR